MLATCPHHPLVQPTLAADNWGGSTLDAAARATSGRPPLGEERTMERSTLIADYSWVWGVNGRPWPHEETPGLDLSLGDVDSALKFWSCVLLYAGGCSHATSVQFFPSLGENCLFVTVDGINYELDPPPEDFRDWLLGVGRNLSAGAVGEASCGGGKPSGFAVGVVA